jgi:ribosomal protein S18 acetylase RimI-like enzyme
MFSRKEIDGVSFGFETKVKKVRDLPVTTPTHERSARIELEADGERIGYAEIRYFRKPFPFCYISSLSIDAAFRGLKLGSDMVRSINAFLDKKKVSGVLINAVGEGTGATNMYERHGWRKTSVPRLLVYGKDSEKFSTDKALSERMYYFLDKWHVK